MLNENGATAIPIVVAHIRGVTDVQKIRTAAGLLAEVMRDSDLRTETCGSCGLVHYLNWTERQWGETLKAGAKKLRRVADEMERNS